MKKRLRHLWYWYGPAKTRRAETIRLIRCLADAVQVLHEHGIDPVPAGTGLRESDPKQDHPSA